MVGRFFEIVFHGLFFFFRDGLFFTHGKDGGQWFADLEQRLWIQFRCHHRFVLQDSTETFGRFTSTGRQWNIIYLHPRIETKIRFGWNEMLKRK